MLENVFALIRDRHAWLLELTLQHLAISAVAASLTTLIGIPLGVLISKHKTLSAIVMGIVNVAYTIPSIALFGILVTISGLGNGSAIAAITLYGLLPVIRNTCTGMRNVPDLARKTAVALGAKASQLLIKIELPLAMPVIVAGLRSMIVMTIAMTGIASFIGAGGLGVAIWRGITTFNPALTLTGSLMVAFLAFLSDALLEIWEKRLRFRLLGVKS